ncbi:cytosol aminopeptidase-like [Periplaneta americana]|uniref:cytosol aminopeptidase-like n=1 Tax=Periplaneta americana TaxID=6978 RepID=UPI0037E7CF27
MITRKVLNLVSRDNLRIFRGEHLRFLTYNPLTAAANISEEDFCAGDPKLTKGLVIGVYESSEDLRYADLKFTKSGQKINRVSNGRLTHMLKLSGPLPARGEVRLLFGIEEEFNAISVVGMGSECAGYNEIEERDEGKEFIRNAAGAGSRALQGLRIQRIYVDSFDHAESAAEGSALAVWIYQELKHKSKQIPIPQLELHDGSDCTSWHIGLQKAAAQNLARQLMDTPANIMTPTTFALNAVEILCQSGINVEVKVQGWAETQKMGAFLSAAKGSCEPPVFLELSYYGTAYDERPVVLVGSGVTFDSGGLCLKEPGDMDLMRGDMSGAACVIATTRAIAHLQLPINIRGLIPLCENTPGCQAMKPGDVVATMSGKNVLVEDTDCEGRLLMADTLYYAQNFWPRFVVDIGTLSKDMNRALGRAATGVFTNSDALWEQIRLAGVHTGDRVWRFPLWDYYNKQVTVSRSVDVRNVGSGRGGGACKAAAFLRQFVPCGEWIHLDNFGVMYANGVDESYLRQGMSGRPTRTLVEFISQLVCKDCGQRK